MGILEPKPQTVAGLDAAVTAKINDTGSAARAALNATYGPAAPTMLAAFARPRYPSLGILAAKLAMVSTSPVKIIFTGSSTTEGYNATSPANRYVNRLTAAIQSAYPAPGGTESSVQAQTTYTNFTDNTTAGVHGYNAGRMGATAANLMSNAESLTLMNLVPAAVIHMVGSNDFAGGIDPAVYKAAIESRLNYMIGNQQAQSVHILVNAFERWDTGTHAYPWAEYGKALRELADARPNSVAYVDLDPAFRAAGIPGSDTFNLTDTDNIHPTDAGHALIAGLLRDALSISKVSAAAAASGPTIVRLVSDTFSTDTSDLGTRTADALLGGAARAWTSGHSPSTFAATGGKFVSTTGDIRFVGFPVPALRDAQVSAKLVTATTGGDVSNFALFSQSNIGDAGADRYCLAIAATTAKLQKRVSGTTTDLYIHTGGSAALVGKRVTVRHYKGKISLLVDGVEVFAATDAAIPRGGYAGVSKFGATGEWDDFTVDLLE